MSNPGPADRTRGFQESVIREMTRVCAREGGINLGQGLPEVEVPDEVKRAACDAIRSDFNQYSFTYGDPELRQALAEKLSASNGIHADPETEITVTCGVSEGLVATCLALLNPGDEAIVFEPFYENYVPAVAMADAIPRFVPLRFPHWTFDPDELAAAFNDRTKAVIVNTPMNPTGHVFTAAELNCIAQLCRKWNAAAVTDEIYEEILYDGRDHVSIASLDGMWERTVTLMGLSKTYGVTGWRVGYVAAPVNLAGAIRKVHDYMVVCAPHPFQRAALAALQLPPDFYNAVRAEYAARRDLFCRGLSDMGFQLKPPEGAYYVLADFDEISWRDEDVDFARRLVRNGGVAAVPGSSFFAASDQGRRMVRFCFAKNRDTLTDALNRIRARLP